MRTQILLLQVEWMFIQKCSKAVQNGLNPSGRLFSVVLLGTGHLLGEKGFKRFVHFAFLLNYRIHKFFVVDVFVGGH